MSNETEWVLVLKDAIERAIETLENDGDEHGEGRNLRAMLDAAPQPPAEAQRCTCPSGDGSLRWPCPAHPPSAPVGVEEILAEMHEEGQADIVDGGIVLEWVDNLRNALAQQPAAVEQPVGVEDFSQHVLRIAGYTGVHYSAKEKCELGAQFYAFTPTELHLFAERIVALAQQPAAVDEAMVERIAALLHEEATDEPWAVAGVEHDGPDRDYYRALARKVIVRADQQPEAAGEMAELVGLLDEVRSHFTRDDDLPDDLLPRIDAALATQQGGVA